MSSTDTAEHPVRRSRTAGTGVLRSAVSTAVAKVLVTGVGGALGVVTSRIILQRYGVDEFAQYGLLNGLRYLLPFADLGIGAIVVNVVAQSAHPRSSPTVQATLTTALRALILSGTVVVLAAILVHVFGGWPALLGDGLMPGGSAVATSCFIVFGLSVPLGVGARILIGLGRNTLQTMLLGLVSPFFLGGLLVLVATGSDSAGRWVATASYAAGTITAAIILVAAGRLVSPTLGRAIADVPRLRRVSNVPVLAVAGPMLVQTVAMPVAMQTDRVLLSHGGTTLDLARYMLAQLIFGLGMQALIASGVSLWPHFARARANGVIATPWRPVAAFLAVTVVFSAVMCVAMPNVARLVAAGRLDIPLGLTVVNSLLLVLQAVNYPIGMYMTDPSGLKFQVVPIALMALTNVTLSWLLIGPYGAIGPVLGSVIAIAVFQVVPNIWWVRRDIARRRATAGAADVA